MGVALLISIPKSLMAEFVSPIPITSNSADLETLVLGIGVLPSGPSTLVLLLNWKMKLPVGYLVLLMLLNQQINNSFFFFSDGEIEPDYKRKIGLLIHCEGRKDYGFTPGYS